MLQVLIPISSNNTFFPKEDYFFPKPIIEVLNKPLIVQVITHLERVLNPDIFIFVIPKDLEITFSLSSIINLATKIPTKFIIRNGNTSGGLSSCLLASDLIEEGELIISNMDEIIDFNLCNIVDNFRISNAAAGVIAYESSHPRWSYGIIDDNNNITFCAEKKVISNFAFAGFYYFKSRSIFIDSCSNVLLEDDSLDGVFYISSALNQIILSQNFVKAYKISSTKHHSLFSPEMIKEFEMTNFAQILRSQSENITSINIVIPSAGKGSRFSNDGWKVPKPFIDIDGKPMLQHVIDNLAIKDSNIHLILQKSHLEKENYNFSSNIADNINIHPIDFHTAGTACTVLNAKSYLDNDNPLLIANSDQIIDFDCNLFIKDALERDLDGSILIFKDKTKNPKWSFAKINDSSLVEEVAEKKPISDLATVGIYFFKKGKDFINSALDMINHDDRVNNEFYTCPIYNYLIRDGKKVGVFEIKLNEMHGVGTPNDLKDYLLTKKLKPSKHAPS